MNTEPSSRRNRRRRNPPVMTLSALLPLLAGAGAAHAHVRWFVEASPPLVPVVSLREMVVWLGVLAMALVLGVAAILHFSTRARHWGFTSWSERHGAGVVRLAQVLIGTALFTSAVQGSIVAPHLTVHGDAHTVLRTLEAVAGLMLISGQWLWLSAILIAALQLLMALHFGWIAALEYLNLLGLAAVVISRPTPRPQQPPPAWAMRVLRITLGMALITLSLSEKLLQPALALEFLARYPVNFMQGMGLAFPDRWFVISAGLAEMLFGLIYLLGWVPRLNTLALAGFLIATNGYFFAIGETRLAWMELVGHTPLFAAALILLAFGRGELPRPLAAAAAAKPPRLTAHSTLFKVR